MVGYYRRLVPSFHRSAYPLCQLRKEEAPSIWTQQHTLAAHDLKTKLTGAVQVRPLDPELRAVTRTDASEYAVRAVLEQQGHPVAFESSKTTETEQSYQRTRRS